MASILNATTTSGLVTSADNSGSLQLQTNNGTTAVTIDTSQNIGVGTTSPARKLDVTGTGRVTGEMLFGNDVQLTGDAYVYSSNGGGVRAGLFLDGTNQVVQIRTAATERMRITSGGALCVATTATTPLGSQTGASNVSTFNQAGITLTQYGVIAGFYYDRLNFNNSQYFVVNSGGTGVYLGNGSTSWTAYSDVRLKNITSGFSNALNDVSQLEPIKFTWKNDDANKSCVGLSAQSVEKVLPEAVDKSKLPNGEDETEYLAVRYTEIIPLLVAAIQELKAELEATKAEVAALKGVA